MSSLMSSEAPPAAPVGAVAGSALASLRGVDKVFGNSVTALSGLNLDVREGEFLSLLGPSGCGKSTVLRLLAGLSSPTRGAIDWTNGRPELGFVFQDPTLMPWGTVFSNVWLPLRFHGVSRSQAQGRIDEALDLVGLTGFANAYPRELSGGMKMRVSIARALVMRPALLLMDEPFAALDEQTRLLLGDKVLQIQQQLKQTTLLITHSITEAVQLSDRILIMSYRPGRVKRIVKVDLPRPRTSDVINSREFGAYVADIWSDLREEASRGLAESERGSG